VTLIDCGKAEIGQISRSFSSKSSAHTAKEQKICLKPAFPALRSVKSDRLLARPSARAHLSCSARALAHAPPL